MKIKDCPDCKGHDVELKTRLESIPMFDVEEVHEIKCYECGLTTEVFFNKDDAIKAWNNWINRLIVKFVTSVKFDFDL